MELKKRIYFSPLGRVISIVQNAFAYFQKPFMVYGYRNKVTGKFLKKVRISSTAVIMDKRKFDIGDNVWIWHDTIIDASHGVKIGEGTQIGANCGIFTHSSHMAIRLMGDEFITASREERKGYITSETVIGEYTFISSGTYILAGVKIGKGCVIGSNSVITKDIPDFSVVVGASKIIKSILPEDEAFFSDPFVREHYFDKEIISNYTKE